MRHFLRSRNVLFLGLLLVGMSLQSHANKVKPPAATGGSVKFPEIEAILKNDGDLVKVPTEADAEKVLLSEIAKPEGGISAAWSWSIRDAYVLPHDWDGIGKADEVVWVGQLSVFSLESQPLAIYFINATTGKVFTLMRPAMKKKTEQAGADQPATAPGTKSGGNSKSQPESEGRSQ